MTIFYTKDHEYIRIDGDVATVGVSDFAQKALGDVVFVELPKPGRVVTKGEAVAVVESVKSASDVYAPLSGVIAAVNDALPLDPALVNQDPEGAGWFFRVTVSGAVDRTDWMEGQAYAEYTKRK